MYTLMNLFWRNQIQNLQLLHQTRLHIFKLTIGSENNLLGTLQYLLFNFENLLELITDNLFSKTIKIDHICKLLGNLEDKFE